MVLNALPISGPHCPYLSNGIIIPVLPASQGCLIRGQAERKELGIGTGYEFQPGSDSFGLVQATTSLRLGFLIVKLSQPCHLWLAEGSGEAMDFRSLLFKPTRLQLSGSFLFNCGKGWETNTQQVK